MKTTSRARGLQVLALAIAAAPACHAQPPDNPVAISAPQPQAPQELPLLPISLDDWLKQSGGLARLTLKMEGATAEEIAAEVKKQTGITLVANSELRGGDGKAPLFSVEATGQTFWQAVRDWNRPAAPDAKDAKDAPRLNLQRDWENRDRWQMVTWGSPSKGRVLPLGPILLTASSLSVSRTRSQDLDPENDPRANAKAEPARQSDSMYLQTTMQIDPKLRPLILGFIAQIDGATDDRGRSIAPGENYQSLRLEDNNDWLSISLAAPARDAVRLRSVAGTLRLGVVTKHEAWEIDLAATPKAEKSFKSEGTEVKVKLDSVALRPGSWSFVLHMERRDIGPARFFKARGRDNGNRMQLGDYNGAERAVRFLNAAGEPVTSDNSSSTSDEENGVRTMDMEVNFNNVLAAKEPKDAAQIAKSTPAKVVIDVPLEWREVTIPFEFKDLPLP